MVFTCMYPGCFNLCKSVRLRAPAASGGALTFHRFPLNNPERLKLWLLAVRWDVSRPVEKLNRALLCSEHFSSDDFEPFKGKYRRLLKPTAVPVPAHFFPPKEDPSKDHVVAQPSLCSTATDGDEKPDVKGASAFFEGVPQSTPVKQRHMGESAGIDTGLHLTLTSPEAGARKTRPSTSGAYIAFPPIRSYPSDETAQAETKSEESYPDIIMVTV
ncbi:peroxynitrite isomerase THAP4-like [Triplophysa rosa]|uniref:THAP domain-containing protein 1 n=1 Tax=Triplophysa rosa TaxID=992332 RepID=A0A9W8C969_TRIRA|nr:peroxynitrite isomerase THAP4-like [Triplophysa rosa]KAI7811004.1 hypothetical protein IRJ41_009238 [Triplophysa rosa]